MLKESTELYMTLVQNHQQQLSGNKSVKRTIKLALVSVLALGVASCTPKVGTLRSPDHSNTTANTRSTATQNVDNTVKLSKFDLRNIALLLPFQLNQIKRPSLTDTDVKRSALALDFYQGFELGLQELAKKGSGFNLDVLDTRDDVRVASNLARTKVVNEASIVVGPVFPKEVKSFGTSFLDQEVLQVNPLAATMASEFNLPNLVSLTPPISAHTKAIAKKVAKDFRTGDIVIVFNSTENDSRQFLDGMIAQIKSNKNTVNIVSVNTVDELNAQLKENTANYVVAGTTDKVVLKTLIDNLLAKYTDNFYNINLFGHPLWDRYDFSIYADFGSLNPVITTESSLRPWSTAVKIFKDSYYQKYGVNPADVSYKGYDAALYFGGMINKYGAAHMKNNLTKDTYNGIFSTYKFIHNDSWGYSNESVAYRIYRAGGFQLQ